MCYCISSKRCTCVQIHSRKCQHPQSPLPFLFFKRLPASTALVYSTAIIFYYCHTTHSTELWCYYNKVLSMHHYYRYFCEKFYSIFELYSFTTHSYQSIPQYQLLSKFCIYYIYIYICNYCHFQIPLTLGLYLK